MFAVWFCRNAIVGLSVFLSVHSFGSVQIGSAVSFSLDTPGAQNDLHVTPQHFSIMFPQSRVETIFHILTDYKNEHHSKCGS